MIKKIIQFFHPKYEEKRDFSTFFNGASAQETKTLMEEVVRKANADQRALVDAYEAGRK